ncbi:L,D-transpeptidase [Pseudonocardia sichuanensis]
MSTAVLRRGRLGLVALVLAGALAGGSGLAFAGSPSGTTQEETPSPAGAASPTGRASPTGDPVLGTPCTSSAAACVDLTSHTAWLLEGGKITEAVPFLAGDAYTPTPSGTFQVEWKAQNYHSREWDVPMPFSVFFAPGGIAFHEGSLSSPSAGCVHLERQDAIAFFAALDVGDQVQVRGEHPAG